MDPFLKWAGGKRWLTRSNAFRLPSFSGTYIEPFLGSGAVYFSLLPEKALLSDINVNLINVYSCIASGPTLVQRFLEEHSRLHSKSYYYQVRQSTFEDKFEKAAQFIYLNRTCFNGLYRVNKKGQFNVPIGTKDTVLLTTDNFLKTSKQLQKASIKACDFEESISTAKSGDLIFVDPPYTTAHNNNGFVRYNETMFSWPDQQRLLSCLVKAGDRGALVIGTNAAHSSLINIYADHASLDVVDRHSVIGGPVSTRTRCEELLFRINF